MNAIRSGHKGNPGLTPVRRLFTTRIGYPRVAGDCLCQSAAVSSLAARRVMCSRQPVLKVAWRLGGEVGDARCPVAGGSCTSAGLITVGARCGEYDTGPGGTDWFRVDALQPNSIYSLRDWLVSASFGGVEIYNGPDCSSLYFPPQHNDLARNTYYWTQGLGTSAWMKFVGDVGHFGFVNYYLEVEPAGDLTFGGIVVGGAAGDDYIPGSGGDPTAGGVEFGGGCIPGFQWINSTWGGVSLSCTVGDVVSYIDVVAGGVEIGGSAGDVWTPPPAFVDASAGGVEIGDAAGDVWTPPPAFVDASAGGFESGGAAGDVWTSGSFDPNSIAGLKLWVKGDGVLWQDAARTIPASTTGNPVFVWDDASPNGNNLSALNTAHRPTFVASDLNGKPTIHTTSSPTTYLFHTFGSALSQPNTVFVVFKVTVPATQFDIFDGVGSSNRNTFGTTAGSQYSLGAATGGNLGTTNTAWHYATVFFNGTSSTLRLGGSPVGGITTGTQSLGGLTLAAAYNATLVLTGAIAEVLVYNASLSTADRNAVEAYLGAKWGL